MIPKLLSKRQTFLNKKNQDHRHYFRESPFPFLLSSNRAPSETEAFFIRRIITETEEEIVDIRKRLHTDMDEPSFDESDHQRLALCLTFVESHRAILSYSRLLPSEILIIIFLHYTADNHNPIHNRSPWILGMITRRWRQIALDVPALWKNLPPIYLQNVTNATISQNIRGSISELLRRSRTCPISFHMDIKGCSIFEMAIFDLMTENCRRWENVSLEISGEVAFFLQCQVKKPLYCLRILRYSVHNRFTWFPATVFEMAPNLQEVYISNEGYALSLPWNQLIRYEEECCSFSGLSKILYLGSNNIKTIKLSTCSCHQYDLNTFDIAETTVLPNLETLELSSSDFRRFPAVLLDKIVTPSLQNLVFRTFSRNAAIFGLQRLLSRSSCHIQSMTFHSYSEHADFLSILYLVPTLISLCINNPSTAVIRALSSVDEQGAWRILPRLLTLKIHLSTIMATDHKAVLRSLRSRCDLETVGQQYRQKLHSARLSFDCYSRTVSPPHLALGAVGGGTSSCEEIVRLYLDTLDLKDNLEACKPVTSSLPKSWAIRKIAKSISRPKVQVIDDHITLPFHELLSKLDGLKVTSENIQLLYISNVDYIISALINHSSIPSMQRRLALEQRLSARVNVWTEVLASVAEELLWQWDESGFLVYVPLDERRSRIPTFRSVQQKIVNLENLPAWTEFYWPIPTRPLLQDRF